MRGTTASPTQPPMTSVAVVGASMEKPASPGQDMPRG